MHDWHDPVPSSQAQAAAIPTRNTNSRQRADAAAVRDGRRATRWECPVQIEAMVAHVIRWHKTMKSDAAVLRLSRSASPAFMCTRIF